MPKIKVNIPETMYVGNEQYSLGRIIEVEIDDEQLSMLASAINAQQSVHPTLGILAAFQAFIYAVKSSVLTAFRRPPQRG